MDIPSLFGDFLLDGVVYRCDLWRCWGESGGRCRCDVGLVCGYWWLPGGDGGLPGGNRWLAWRRGDPLWRQRRFGHGCGWGSRGGSCRFGDNGEDSLWSHRWVDGGSGPLLIQVRDVVVMIWRRFSWSRGFNNHLWNG